ncbi:uncharacterized protein [Rutidosis leptorrhynchoides]|uniref:uncharacterized protein n=1 Tax=Rutidosis leptorrhynchoides TaxID=125765 RepID=UPI003A99CD0F
MEGLNLCFKREVERGNLSGAKVGSPSVTISHLFYADDAIIISKWNRDELSCIIRVLDRFHEWSGLSVNISKSSLFGVCVSTSEVDDFTSFTGCSKGVVPFTYLGLPTGVSMNRLAHWNTLLDKFKKQLSGWKANLLSIGGRLTLIRSVLNSLGIYYFSLFKCPDSIVNDIESLRSNFFWGSCSDAKKMHWLRWDQVIAPMDQGGLNIGSTCAFNYALLLKWIWHFTTDVESHWGSVIRAIYGSQGGLDGIPKSRLQVSGPVCQWRLVLGLVYTRYWGKERVLTGADHDSVVHLSSFARVARQMGLGYLGRRVFPR